MRLVNRPETFYRPAEPRNIDVSDRLSRATVFYIGFISGVGVGALVVTVLVMANGG